MDYYELHIKSEIDPAIVTAYISTLPFESFQEDEEGSIRAFIPVENFVEEDWEEVRADLERLGSLTYSRTRIPGRNWNAVWESNFQPVIIEDRIWIGASFHTPPGDIEFQLTIDPKMSFGTAHHATTRQMLAWMLELDMRDKKVLDMGTGTGILAIMAERRGASSVFAIDNDGQIYDNIVENMERNAVRNIRVKIGDIEDVPEEKYDLILANINRNILLRHMPGYARRMKEGSQILFSGFYEEDIPVLEKEAQRYGLQRIAYRTLDRWVVLLMEKKEE